MTDWSEGPRDYPGEDDSSATQPAPPPDYVEGTHIDAEANDMPPQIHFEKTPAPGDEWDKPKAETIGRAVNKDMYEIGSWSGENSNGHPAEAQFRKMKEDSFEQLYNLDPERFGAMPTADFMRMHREYSPIAGRLEAAQADFRKAEELQKKFFEEHGINSNEKAELAEV